MADKYGVGAWAYGFFKYTEGEPLMGGDYPDRAGRAALAFKLEYIHNGYDGSGLKCPLAITPWYGKCAGAVTARFQKNQSLKGLTPGVLGPSVARVLFRKRSAEVEAHYGIPDHLLSKLKSLESNDDPAAVGYLDDRDRGLLQINSFFHPDVSDDEAFDPAFSLDWGGKNLSLAFKTFDDWDVAIASHNVGWGGAQDWLDSGKLAEGGPDWFPQLYSRATQYVRLVRSQSV
jgi:hypothetical protein